MRSRALTFSSLALLALSLLGSLLALAYSLPSCSVTSFDCPTPSGLALLFSPSGTALTLPWFLTLAFALAFVLHLRNDRWGSLATLAMLLYAVAYFDFEFHQRLATTSPLSLTLFLYAVFISAAATFWLSIGALVTRAAHAGRLPQLSR